MRAITNLAVARRALESRIRQQFGLKPRPYKLLLELTAQCSSRCKHCGIWKTPARIKAQELTLEEIDQLLSQSGNDIAWLALSGGEVTEYESFPSVIRALQKYCRNLRVVTFTTNGLRPEKALEWAQLVERAGFEIFVTISLDGDEKTHDMLRGIPGNYVLAWKTYRNLRDHGIAAHFGVTLSSHNESFFLGRYQELRNKIKAVTMVHSAGIYRQDNAVDDASIMRSLARVVRAYPVSTFGELVEKIYIALGIPFLESGRSKNVIPCAVGHTSLHVQPTGVTRLCMFLPPIGNVRDGRTLREMANSAVSRQLLENIAKDGCPHCWMNCYAPHSVLNNPVKAVYQYFAVVLRRGMLWPWSSRDPTTAFPLYSTDVETSHHRLRVLDPYAGPSKIHGLHAGADVAVKLDETRRVAADRG